MDICKYRQTDYITVFLQHIPAFWVCIKPYALYTYVFKFAKFFKMPTIHIPYQYTPY